MAQTERNRVQSQARADALHEAAQAGVIVTKKWSARMRNTRDSHAALNGVEIPENEKFRTIWGNELRYPGDPEAPAAEVINCHCVLIPDVKLPPENSAVRLKKEAESGIIKAWDEAYQRRKTVKNSELQNGIPFKGEPNSIFDKTDDEGNVLQRRVYGADGVAKYDFDTSDHGRPKLHPMGAHKHIIQVKNKNTHASIDYLTEEELAQNADIIKRGVNYFDK